jgi:hypothetical protein
MQWLPGHRLEDACTQGGLRPGEGVLRGVCEIKCHVSSFELGCGTIPVFVDVEAMIFKGALVRVLIVG